MNASEAFVMKKFVLDRFRCLSVNPKDLNITEELELFGFRIDITFNKVDVNNMEVVLRSSEALPFVMKASLTIIREPHEREKFYFIKADLHNFLLRVSPFIPVRNIPRYHEEGFALILKIHCDFGRLLQQNYISMRRELLEIRRDISVIKQWLETREG